MTRKDRILQVLQEKCKPAFIELHDESAKHHVPIDGESHFKLILVANDFERQDKVSRQRWIYQLLTEEFQTGLHALSMSLYSLAEWQKSQKVPSTPDCLDGYSDG